jgi:hypothetical protein
MELRVSTALYSVRSKRSAKVHKYLLMLQAALEVDERQRRVSPSLITTELLSCIMHQSLQPVGMLSATSH